MSFICVSLPPNPQNCSCPLSYLLTFPLLCFCPPVPAFHSRNYGNGTEVITGAEVG